MNAILRTNQSFKRCPLALQLLFLVRLLALGGFLKFRIEFGLGILRNLNLGEATLVVNRNRRSILYGSFDVVDADVVAKDGARVGVGSLNRRPGEPDKGCARERVAHVPRVAIHEVVLTPVGFIGNHDDVGSIGEEIMLSTALLGEEFVDRGKDHASRIHAQKLSKVGSVASLNRSLPKQILATRKGSKELIIEVVSVGQNHDGWILHRRVQNHSPSVERHRQALPGTLGVPNHSHSAVAGASCFHRLRHVAGTRLPHDHWPILSR